MLYYMRSNDAHDDSRYLMHAWGDGKGSWGQHKYIDKRWISGAWKYLYELPKNIRNSVNNFRNYSTNVDTRASQAGARKAQNARNRQSIISEQQKNSKLRVESIAKEQDAEKRRTESAIGAKNAYEQNQRDKNALGIASDTYMQSFADNQKWQANEDKLEKMHSDIAAGKDVNYEEMGRLEEEQRRLTDAWHREASNNSEEWLNTARERENNSSAALEGAKNSAYEATRERDSERDKQKEYDARSAELQEQRKQNEEEYWQNQVAEERANAEKETWKYKASRFLDNILDGADEITASGASWLKKQMDAGGKWLDGAVTAIGTKLDFGNNMRETAIKVTNALNRIGEVADNTTKAGADFLKNLFGSRDVAPENVVEPEGLPSRSMPQPSSGGRQYNGTSQKAEVQLGEGDKRHFDELSRISTEAIAIEDQIREMARNGKKDTPEYDALWRRHNELLEESTVLERQYRNGSLGETLRVPGGSVSEYSFGGISSSRPSSRNKVEDRALRNAEYKLQEAREKAGWKMTSNGYSGPSTPEVQAAMEEYLRLRERYGN